MKIESIKNNVDFAIITIKQEEFDAVLCRFESWTGVAGGRHIYIFSQVSTPGGCEYSIVLTRCLEQGQGAAQQITNDLIEDIKPKLLVLVGIAGGVPAIEYTLGDIILASRLYDFSVSAINPDRSIENNTSGGPIHPSVSRILEVISAYKNQLGEWNSVTSISQEMPVVNVPEDINDNAYYGDLEWKEKVHESIRHHFCDTSTKRQPIYRVAPTASSNFLVKNIDIIQQWQDCARSVSNVEMELGGVYRAAWRGERIYPVLAIRSLSDIVGYKRSSEWTEYACNAAAAFTYSLIKTGILGSIFQLTSSANIENLASNQSMKKKVRITLDLELEKFLELQCDEKLKYTLAGFLGVDVKKISIEDVEEGSVKVTVEIPEDLVDYLIKNKSKFSLLLGKKENLVVIDIEELPPILQEVEEEITSLKRVELYASALFYSLYAEYYSAKREWNYRSCYSASEISERWGISVEELTERKICLVEKNAIRLLEDLLLDSKEIGVKKIFTRDLYKELFSRSPSYVDDSLSFSYSEVILMSTFRGYSIPDLGHFGPTLPYGLDKFIDQKLLLEKIQIDLKDIRADS
ncbi:5'-methylthioadenosine/S-adenosylhomocysteine nucleosidase family protein [Acaryochloris marina]|uniref:Nucleoside phosphorylase domain-containing protein n=1 Tax=Acaryochloris marina (strain MBIC 11017) TaxID=329726 RepID=A8ZLI4_ACAM1|nr:hypothetical protein [Acaryochloris marina]ABW32011.1 hypothetical protein AM1_B0292 [Acaryochloris marina MBIC11017]BDM82810.1 hypothetical protein AM10699_56710 [Acaryochloris marina MBIC10699]